MTPYKLLFSFFMISLLLHSCSKGTTLENPTGTTETGNGKVRGYNGFEFSYDSKGRLINLEPNPLINNTATAITRFFYKDDQAEFYRVEISSINNPDLKIPVVLQYNNKNNIEKIIYKQTIYPPSPDYNNLTFLSSYNPSTEAPPDFIDSIIYNSQNNPLEIFRIKNSTVSQTKISYYPGDTLMKSIVYPSITPTSIFCVNFGTNNINPLYKAHKNLYLLDNNLYRLPRPVLPVNLAYTSSYSLDCDKYIGLSKYFPRQIEASGLGYNGPTSVTCYFMCIADSKGNITKIIKTNSTYTDSSNNNSRFTY